MQISWSQLYPWVFVPLLLVAPPLPEKPEVERLRARVVLLEAEVKALRERLATLEGDRPATSATPKEVAIKVLPGNWGDADVNDIRAVCRSAASEMARYFPRHEQDPITVRHDARPDPLVIYGKGSDGERRILVNVKGKYWAQLAFQFSHEFCHIQCNYRDGDRANLWFEESLCETASLFVLRRMAQTWKTRPPYSNWKSFAGSLHDYAAQRLKETEKLDGLTLAQWYQRNEPELTKTGVNRAKNQVVAAALLPLFEMNPEHWEAVRSLNQGDAKKRLSFPDYLRDWHARVTPEHRPFVAEIAKLFEVKLK